MGKCFEKKKKGRKKGEREKEKKAENQIKKVQPKELIN